MGWVRRAGILLTVLVVAAGIGGAAAGAKKHKKKGKQWATKVTLAHPSNSQFTGAVSSKLSACRTSRVVILFYTDPNTQQTSPLSVQRTNGKGKYTVNLTKPTFAGEYQVGVEQRKVRAQKKKQTCKSATSPAIQV
jgi:hypothetical protein